VIGTARAAKHAFLAGIGTDETIDYTTEAVEDRVRDVDVVLDLVGDEASAGALETIRDGGIFISVPSGSSLDALREAAGDRARVTGILVEPDRQGMEAIADLAASGALRAEIAQTFPLADAARAHELGETGRTQGKLVLTL
jgi:NADPH:quinone reductase-like Zn-dependent oxidoreductase